MPHFLFIFIRHAGFSVGGQCSALKPAPPTTQIVTSKHMHKINEGIKIEITASGKSIVKFGVIFQE
jgi:hypothetical protein